MKLLTRTITAVLFGATVLFCIQKGGLWFQILWGLVTVLSAEEFSKLACLYRNSQANRLLTVLASAFAYMGGVSLFALNTGFLFWFLPFLAVLTVIMVRELYAQKESPMADMAYSLFPVFYIALPMSLLSDLAYRMHDGTGYSPAIPLMLFLCIWANDMGAYFAGCTMGRHKLFERVSPKKTWEGSAGGAVLTVAVAAVLSGCAPSMFGFQPIWVWIGMAVVTVVFGTWGDLVESLMKREMGIKDSGNILPGHGGMLDRFDSSLLAIPAVTVYFCLIIALT